MSAVFIKLFWICFLLAAFDFKGQQSGGIYQIVSFSGIVICLAVMNILLLNRRTIYASNKLQILNYYLLGFLAYSFVVAFLQGVLLSRYITVIAPYVLFILSFCVVNSLCKIYNVDTVVKEIYPIIKVSVFLAIIWTVFVAFQRENVSILTVRYYAVASTMPFAIAYMASSIASGVRNKIEYIFFFFVVLILIISQTRSTLVAVTVTFVFAALGNSRNLKTWTLTIFKIFVPISFAGLLLIIINYGYTQLGQTNDFNFLNLWTERLFGSIEKDGFDVTTAARLGEFDDQLNKLFSTPINFFLGLGFGAPYTYSGVYADLVAINVGIDEIPEDYWNGSHSLWVYTFFTSGLIVGSAAVGFFCYVLRRTFVLILAARFIMNRHRRHLSLSLGLSYICIIAGSFTSFPFGSRAVGLTLGAVSALILCLSLRANTVRNIA
ncbi:MAG: hypothetical protein H7240_10180 [Glaciimonas sp.]|nr:hypothetical protein [Glaciimonas sp.]